MADSIISSRSTAESRSLRLDRLLLLRRCRKGAQTRISRRILQVEKIVLLLNRLAWYYRHHQIEFINAEQSHFDYAFFVVVLTSLLRSSQLLADLSSHSLQPGKKADTKFAGGNTAE